MTTTALNRCCNSISLTAGISKIALGLFYILAVNEARVTAAPTSASAASPQPFQLPASVVASNNNNTTTTTSSSISTSTTNHHRTWRLITRAEWQARTPTTTANFTGPSPYVIIHHSYQPGVCRTTDACKASMRSMQNFHVDGHGWPDIGYSFAIGGDGNVYEARGYDVVGAHAPNYNSRSIGLLLIGNFVSELPPEPMIRIAKDFIKYSVEIGELQEDYILYGHRQVRSTDCPGDALYAEITKWPHWREVEQKKGNKSLQ